MTRLEDIQYASFRPTHPDKKAYLHSLDNLVHQPSCLANLLSIAFLGSLTIGTYRRLKRKPIA